MTDKQTRCPTCNSIYKVTVTQLTVSQGMVCCPKCSTNFNALLGLINQESQTSQEQKSGLIKSEYTPEISILDIFKRKTENSNIDLRTYLNSLNQFNSEPLQNIPALHLSSQSNSTNQKPQKTIKYYLIWSIVNLTLLSILCFQILWFNPKLTDQYSVLNALFTKTCAILSCDTMDQRYSKMDIERLKVEKIGKNKTEFSGILINNYEKSLALPLIKVTLKAEGKNTTSYIMNSSQYLNGGLSGISRIPTARPYRFKFTMNQARNSFDDYVLEIIHP
ncbi:DUF3426 domain-containing protein [Acinetobacter sp. ANC 4648]|uniref:DUF3426 domain-containing protein n=1 Tax=Acinetobacter sp. ANC 4648 TaxID=1977875 RepID=UPI000A350390|nr:DUF3426 domain-containing protein [Acinetobacter sp. ANC 4648]OTG83074.1 hypothetical protein B9T27_07330 [Acinetobacter sp. ANC 4648]